MGHGLHYLGAEEIGDGSLYGDIFKAAGGLASGAISAYEGDEEQAKLARDEESKVSAAIAADNAASVAAARAALSTQAHSPSAVVDNAAVQSTATVQDRAAATLSSDGADKRAAAADKALAQAISSAQSKPKDKYLVELVKAWTATSNKAHNTSITSQDDGGDKSKKGKGKKGGDSESWITRPVLGPVPGYGVIVLGTGVVGGLGYVIKRILSK